jgi:hypothetical protein
MVAHALVVADDTLDLTAPVGQRSATFRFDLVEATSGQNLGQLHPLQDTTPTLSHDTSRTIKRTLDNLTLGQADAAQVDPIAHRIQPSMVLGDGRTYPLGRYMFGDYTTYRFTAGTLASAALIDEMFIIDQPLTTAFDAGLLARSVDEVIKRLLLPVDVTLDIEPSPFTAAHSAWPAGTSRAKVLQDLATQGGYLSPWFGHDGHLHVIRSFEPADRVANLDLDIGGRVLRGSVSEVNDLLSAPNRFIVVGNTGTTDTAVVGTYDVPNSAPHSITNRGFVIADVHELQITVLTQAAAAAAAIGRANTVFERTELSTVPDPRHNSYDVIGWLDQRWLELSWSMELREGGTMRHVLRKAYTP